ncbi:MAG: NERD domain-containing protein [Kangiellaceae bacterium]|nr:NERD domain-containing protein [Kangiellaceae bacterium]
MDIFIICITLVVLALASFVLYDSFFKKKHDSDKIKKATNFFLNSNDYYLMTNVVLLTFDGLQKFDYLIISRYGVFIVMAQHYSGIISGNESKDTWTQELKNHNTLNFSNPTQVVNERVQTICGFLGLTKEEVFPVVLFTGIKGFKYPMSRKFTFGSRYIEYIRSKTEILLTSQQIENFVRSVENKRKRQGLINESDQIEQNQQRVLSLEYGNLCPSCGSAMEIRSLNDGPNNGRKILACKLYPTCNQSRLV